MNELRFELRVPGGIKEADIGEEIADARPRREMLVFRHVADGGEGFAGYFCGIDTEDRSGAAGRTENVHENFDERGFSSAVGTDERMDGAFRHGKIEAIESAHTAELLRQGLGLDAKHGGAIAGTRRIANKNVSRTILPGGL